jgi:hypothetical protein
VNGIIGGDVRFIVELLVAVLHSDGADGKIV